MDPTEEVVLWNAPQPNRDAGREVIHGFEPNDYPGDGPYFALSRPLAEQSEAVNKNGLQEICILFDDFVELQQDSIIQPDGYLPGQSCHVPPMDCHASMRQLRRGTKTNTTPNPTNRLAKTEPTETWWRLEL